MLSVCPDVITIEEARRIFAVTRVLSFRAFFLTLDSPGLRPGEALRPQVGRYRPAHVRKPN